MSSIMRARSALTGRWEAWEVIGGSSPKPKVAGPSMLGIGCPDRHALPITHTSAAKNALTVTRRPPARAGSFVGHGRLSLPGQWYSRSALSSGNAVCAPAVTLGAKIGSSRGSLDDLVGDGEQRRRHV